MKKVAPAKKVEVKKAEPVKKAAPAKKVAEVQEDGAVDENVFASFKEKFSDALCNDLNTSMAITVLYDLLKADTNDATKLALIRDFDAVLSLELYEEGRKLAEVNENAGIDAELEAFVLAKIEERAAAKKEKDFAKADAIREELLAKGVAIKDTREGVKWELI